MPAATKRDVRGVADAHKDTHAAKDRADVEKRLTWNEFQAKCKPHKLSQKEISSAWAQYKADGFQLPAWLAAPPSATAKPAPRSSVKTLVGAGSPVAAGMQAAAPPLSNYQPPVKNFSGQDVAVGTGSRPQATRHNGDASLPVVQSQALTSAEPLAGMPVLAPCTRLLRAHQQLQATAQGSTNGANPAPQLHQGQALAAAQQQQLISRYAQRNVHSGQAGDEGGSSVGGAAAIAVAAGSSGAGGRSDQDTGRPLALVAAAPAAAGANASAAAGMPVATQGSKVTLLPAQQQGSGAAAGHAAPSYTPAPEVASNGVLGGTVATRARSAAVAAAAAAAASAAADAQAAAAIAAAVASSFGRAVTASGTLPPRAVPGAQPVAASAAIPVSVPVTAAARQQPAISASSSGYHSCATALSGHGSASGGHSMQLRHPPNPNNRANPVILAHHDTVQHYIHAGPAGSTATATISLSGVTNSSGTIATATAGRPAPSGLGVVTRSQASSLGKPAASSVSVSSMKGAMKQMLKKGLKMLGIKKKDKGKKGKKGAEEAEEGAGGFVAGGYEPDDARAQVHAQSVDALSIAGAAGGSVCYAPQPQLLQQQQMHLHAYRQQLPPHPQHPASHAAGGHHYSLRNHEAMGHAASGSGMSAGAAVSGAQFSRPGVHMPEGQHAAGVGGSFDPEVEEAGMWSLQHSQSQAAPDSSPTRSQGAENNGGSELLGGAGLGQQKQLLGTRQQPQRPDWISAAVTEAATPARPRNTGHRVQGDCDGEVTSPLRPRMLRSQTLDTQPHPQRKLKQLDIRTVAAARARDTSSGKQGPGDEIGAAGLGNKHVIASMGHATTPAAMQPLTIDLTDSPPPAPAAAAAHVPEIIRRRSVQKVQPAASTVSGSTLSQSLSRLVPKALVQRFKKAAERSRSKRSEVYEVSDDGEEGEEAGEEEDGGEEGFGVECGTSHPRTRAATRADAAAAAAAAEAGAAAGKGEGKGKGQVKEGGTQKEKRRKVHITTLTQAGFKAPGEAGWDELHPLVAGLPTYSGMVRELRGGRKSGYTLRKKPPREIVHHDAPCFDGFGNWVQVTQATTSALLRKVPADPGLYEWAAMAPDDGPLMAFYLGKASTSLRQRLRDYIVVRGRWVCPHAEGRPKIVPWMELQRRGFALFYRWRVAPPGTNAKALEGALLGCVDYAWNQQENGARRQLMLQAGKKLGEYPVLFTD